jgi:glycosyltransferase involved in cell wall biosynthesis
MTDRPLISVIVPFRNGASELPALVEALKRQTLPRDAFEVILVDDGSSDSGPAWLREQLPSGWLVIAHPVSRGSYAARNTGLARSTATHLAFTDVDCRPRPDWLERGLGELSTSPRVAGRIHFDPPASPSIVELVDMGRFFRQHQYVNEGFAATANLFIHRAVFDVVGPFDATLRWGGDYELGRRCLRAGIPIRYAETVVIDHRPRSSLVELLRKGEHVGYGAGQIARRGGSSVGAFVKRAMDRLTLTRARGLSERDIKVERTMQSVLVSCVLLLVMMATSFGCLRGFVSASKRAVALPTNAG